MNTTTCAHCGQDFPDRDMIPLEQGGELCIDCVETLRDAAPDLLAALQRIADFYADDGDELARIARRALAKATGS